MSKRIQWKKIITSIDDAVAYYEKHFAGMSRSEVARDTKNNGRKFYAYITREGWVEEVLPESKHIDWETLVPDIEAAEIHYKENYTGMSRTELQKDIENGGNGFYKYLRRQKWQDKILPKSKHIDWLTTVPNVETAKKHYEEHYAGMNRSELRKDTENAGGAFYSYLLSQGWRDQVLPKSQRINWSELVPDIDTARDFYEEHYAGMSRSEIKENTENDGCAFYNFLKRQGWQDDVLPESKQISWITIVPDEEAAKQYYQEHYTGMSRSELCQDKEHKGASFYWYIRKQGWMEGILPPPKRGIGAENAQRDQLESLLKTYAED